MVRSNASTVAAYIKELPSERREVMIAVRNLILKHLPSGYEERMNWGMIAYEIPLPRYPTTCNGQPLCCAGLAAQKNYFSLYLMTVYQDSAEEKRLRAGFKKAGKKLDMGKSCIRFRKLEELALEPIAEAIAGTPPDRLIAQYEASRHR